MNEGEVSALRSFFRRKWVRIVLVLDILIIIVLIAIMAINANKTVKIKFEVTPLSSTILMNGVKYENGTYTVDPGKYEIQISHEGMDTKTFEVKLEAQDNLFMTTYLSDDGKFGFYELKENYPDFEVLRSMASAGDNRTFDHDTSAMKFIKDFDDNYTLMEKLPVINQEPSKYGLEYGVGYEYDVLTIMDGADLDECVKTLCLYVTDTLGGREQYAKSLIDRMGYDANDYQIIYEQVGYEEE